MRTATALLAFAAAAALATGRTAAPEAPPPLELVVTSAADAGPGSLRAALEAAVRHPGPVRVALDPELFAEPRTIALATELPELTGQIEIDGAVPDRLWTACGATVSGEARVRVLRVAAGARVTLRNLTLADGCADLGGGVLNHGDLVLESVTVRDCAATVDGGGVANLGGTVTMVNSTLVGNRAAARGGGLANLGGHVAVTHATLAGNAAGDGGGLHSDGELLLTNSILADSPGGGECRADGLHPDSRANLVEDGTCGAAVTGDPRLGPLGFYNGPTPTLAIGAGSPAVNRGDVTGSVDASGRPLVWDQRGNGDPRVVGGLPDLGAFEYQRLPHLVVDRADDAPVRGCTRAAADCTLRAAIEIANGMAGADVVRFDAEVLAGPRIVLDRPLPQVTEALTLELGPDGGPSLTLAGRPAPVTAAPGVQLLRTAAASSTAEPP